MQSSVVLRTYLMPSGSLLAVPNMLGRNSDPCSALSCICMKAPVSVNANVQYNSPTARAPLSRDV